MKVLKKTLLAVCVAASFIPAAQAEKFFSDSSISVLYSDDYEAFGRQQRTDTYFTFENATGHNWGSTFFFFDRNQGHGSSQDNDDLYGEFAPNISLGWLTGNDLSYGLIKDVTLSGQYELGGGADVNNYLLGLGLDWNIPGLQYFGTRAYHVNNSETDNDYQLTVVWGAPMEFGPHRVLLDGYMDWSTSADDHESELHFNPQLKLDIGNYFNNPRVLYAGIEYSYWNNKYGLGDAVMDTESATSALIKLHF
ncbi:outer membrane protein OmpK [Pseudomonas sp. OIL-1]|uniref:outer membrane protein OmpK n=1 Tax=Pseudomonas sp. OIL-1 TaxID=2706126 RepID=UPI0013A7798C|nr:outer membrane protein OmpK [Pseudomonas sp. OIL-1]QIB51336.1 hypothetical protein G3M63_09945 [Pseudomonas sp. OIL-1]